MHFMMFFKSIVLEFSLINISTRLCRFVEKSLDDISYCSYFCNDIWAYGLFLLVVSLFWTEKVGAEEVMCG